MNFYYSNCPKCKACCETWSRRAETCPAKLHYGIPIPIIPYGKKNVAIIVDSCFAKNEKNKSFHHGLANTSLFGSDQWMTDDI